MGRFIKALTLAIISALGLFFCSPAAAQDVPVDSEVVHPYKRVTVPDLAAVTSKDRSSAAVVKAALAIVLSVPMFKCDPNTLETTIDANAGISLRTLASRLSGAVCLVNGRTVRVTASFTPNREIQANNLIASLLRGEPLLLEWKGALYVLYGTVYDEHLHYSGRRDNIVRELLLIDPRYSDYRRFVTFERDRDKFAEVEGIASIGVNQ